MLAKPKLPRWLTVHSLATDGRTILTEVRDTALGGSYPVGIPAKQFTTAQRVVALRRMGATA